MLDLTDINVIRDVMSRFGKKFAKSLGQNFLTSAETIENIVEMSDIDEDTFVLEIGPGIGVLTQSLAAHAKKVVSVEIDKNLLPVLDYTLADCDNVTVINEDIMKTDIPQLCKKYFGGKKAKVVANLPYYITTHIIMKLIEYKEYFSSVTVMVQKEVAERMSAKEGKKDFGAFTVAVLLPGGNPAQCTAGIFRACAESIVCRDSARYSRKTVCIHAGRTAVF